MRALATALTILTALLTPPCAAQTSGAVAHRITAERTAIAVTGVITPAVADAFIRTLDAAPADHPVVIDLDSPGGYVKAGYAMIDAILRHRTAGRSVTTSVRGAGVCESMCFGVFMAGYPRQAAPGASFMVHAPRDMRTGAISLRATNEMIARLRALGTSGNWLHRVRADGGFSGHHDHVERAETLALPAIGIVTELVERP